MQTAVNKYSNLDRKSFLRPQTFATSSVAITNDVLHKHQTLDFLKNLDIDSSIVNVLNDTTKELPIYLLKSLFPIENIFSIGIEEFSTFLFEEPGLTIDIENMIREFILLGIRIPRPGEIRNYMLIHPDMTPVVKYVCFLAKKNWLNNAQLSLELYRDPEIEDEYLTLYVRLDRYDKTIVNTIKNIRKEYEDLLINKSGWLLLTTDFRKPE